MNTSRERLAAAQLYSLAKNINSQNKFAVMLTRSQGFKDFTFKDKGKDQTVKAKDQDNDLQGQGTQLVTQGQGPDLQGQGPGQGLGQL